MTKWQIAFRSLHYYLRANFAIAIGVAAATAVLTGALVIGDSMRTSLRELTLERLGKIDEILVSDGFFRQELAVEIKQLPEFQIAYENATPVIMFPGGTVENKPDDTAWRAGQVSVLGIEDEFWTFDNSKFEKRMELKGESAIINSALARELKINATEVAAGNARVTVRIPKQNQLPADSALGRKTDLIESLVDLTVIQIIPTTGLGRFNIHPSQSEPLNVYLPIKLLQESLGYSVLQHKSDPAQANVLMISSKSNTPPAAEVSTVLRNSIRPTLEDFGLTLKRVTQEFGEGEDAKTIFDYWSLSSDQLVLSDEAVTSISSAFPTATPVFTYLANDIRKPDQTSGIPFSMVASVDFGDSFEPVSAITNTSIHKLAENEIVLNQWAAADLDVQPGEKIIVTFFEPETTHGSQLERSTELSVVDVAKLTQPDQASPAPISSGTKSGSFSVKPEITNDPDLTPEVPGVTDAVSIDNWDLPFETADKIRPQDDVYWEDFRTTPKAFVSLATGRRLWQSRFGMTTSFRIPVDAGDSDQISRRLLDQFAVDNNELGMHLVAIKRQGLEASSGSTPFDVLFLALSMFVIGAALILVSILFRLGLQQRASEVGLLKAIGFDQRRIRRLWLCEMIIVASVGAVIGVLLGIGYAWLMIWGLSTWWLGAISQPFLRLSLSPLSLCFGLVSGLLICVWTITWSLRRTRNQPVRCLLDGQLESEITESGRKKGIFRWIAPGLMTMAILLTLVATQLSGMAQAGAFMGAGFLILTALLMFVHSWLRKPGEPELAGRLSLSRLAILSARRNPLRSTLTIGLVSVASFLIAAVSSFRLMPTDAGTGGFDWVAQSSQPVFDDLSAVEGQEQALGVGNQLTPGTDVMSFRFKPGEDASCNNLYQSTQPRVLGVTNQFIEYFNSTDVGQFAWAENLASAASEKQNPWRLLESEAIHSGRQDDPIPVILDKNTANYSLKILLLNTVKQVDYDSGETIHYRVVGFLENTILQGSLIMSEQDFENAFPAAGGYQYFLIRDGHEDGNSEAASNVAILEDRLGDQGFDARSAPKLLMDFMAVQNTYISTFQTLGALGLLLGTFGLAAVQIRSVLERKKELGLMRAVGFDQRKLSWMVLMENAWLLLMGMGVGIGAALFTTVPHWFVGNASVPWLALSAMFAGIVGVGLIAGWLASRIIARMPLLDSLRA